MSYVFDKYTPFSLCSDALAVTLPGPLSRSVRLSADPLPARPRGCTTASANVAQGQRCLLETQETSDPLQGLLNLEGVRRNDSGLPSLYSALRKSGEGEVENTADVTDRQNHLIWALRCFSTGAETCPVLIENPRPKDRALIRPTEGS